MGASFSNNHNNKANDAKNRMSGQTLAEKRRRALERYGMRYAALDSSLRLDSMRETILTLFVCFFPFHLSFLYKVF